MDRQGDLWDVYVLLQVEETHLKLSQLFLHRRGHLVPFPVSFARLPEKEMVVMLNSVQQTIAIAEKRSDSFRL